MKIVTIRAKYMTDEGKRIDAPFHLSDAVKTKRLLENCPYPVEPLSKVTKDIFSGPRFKRVYVNSEKTGIPFLSGSATMKASFGNLKYISKKYTYRLEELIIEKGWSLVTRSGTVGQVSYATADFEGKAGTEDLIRVIPNNKLIPSGFIYSYFKSKYGHALLTQSTYGGVIKHIEPHHIAELPIPILPENIQQTIHENIEKSALLREEANRLLKEATDYFDNQFFIFLKEDLKIFTKRRRDLRFSWTGRNNDKNAELIEERIKSIDFGYINEVVENSFAPPLFKHIYLKNDNGHPFYSGIEVSRTYRKRNRHLSPLGVKDINKYKVKDNQILVYKSGPRNGMLGYVFIVEPSLVGACLSDHVIRLEFNDKKMQHWIFAFLKSKTGLRLLHNVATGTAILFITPDRLTDIPFPKPKNEELDYISSIVEKYIQASEQSQLLHNQSITQLENEIASWQK